MQVGLERERVNVEQMMVQMQEALRSRQFQEEEERRERKEELANLESRNVQCSD